MSFDGFQDVIFYHGTVGGFSFLITNSTSDKCERYYVKLFVLYKAKQEEARLSLQKAMTFMSPWKLI